MVEDGVFVTSLKGRRSPPSNLVSLVKMVIFVKIFKKFLFFTISCSMSSTPFLPLHSRVSVPVPSLDEERVVANREVCVNPKGRSPECPFTPVLNVHPFLKNVNRGFRTRYFPFKLCDLE